MNTTKRIATAQKTLRNTVLLCLILAAAGVAGAANIPTGMTGLWRFQSSADKLKATVGFDLTMSNPSAFSFWTAPWIMIGVPANAGLYADGGAYQDWSWEYLTVNPGFTANGGGSYVNEYSIMWDVKPDPNLNSLYQTAYGAHDNEPELWINAATRAASTIGVNAAGFSSSTFDGNSFHRVVLSVKNGSFFRVYVDGTNYLNGAGQPVDGRFALYPDRFHLFVTTNWDDAWITCETVATWNRALTADEIAGMGGWLNASATPTDLMFSETPELLSVTPADGETNVAPDIAYQARVLDPAHVLTAGNFQLLLDGVPTSPAAVSSGAMLIVQLNGGLLPSGTTHTYTLIGGASGIYFTNTVTFTVQKYTRYEWRFTSGDLSPALGNGIMAYADATTTPPLTSFGTTDGSTVPHINGIPAKYMHVPAFTLNTDGYTLELTDSGPNVGANPSINRYTFLADVMVPGPLDWTPFFNTNPYDDNDADFYLASDGSVGITDLYSDAGVVTGNAWYRIAFVADLGNSTMSYYVNGAQVATGSQNGSDVEGRWSLYSNLDPGPDLFLFNEGDDTGVYTHELYVSSVAFTDRVLSPAEVAALGGPSANGIFVPSTSTAPKLTIQAAVGGAALSWPTNYVGYVLQQCDSLTAPQWAPVAGITNNSVAVSASSAAKFYRLVQ